MPQPAVRIDHAPVSASPRRVARPLAAEPVLVTLGEGDIAWTASPARQLHDRLLESFAAPAPRREMTLSRRQRLFILAGLATFLWALIGAGAAALIR